MSTSDNIEELKNHLEILNKYVRNYSTIMSAIEDIEDNINHLKNIEIRNQINLAKNAIDNWEKNKDNYISNYEKDYILWYIDYLEGKSKTYG